MTVTDSLATGISCEGAAEDTPNVIPSRDDIRKCVIRAETVSGEAPPLLLTQADRPVALQAALDATEDERESA